MALNRDFDEDGVDWSASMKWRNADEAVMITKLRIKSGKISIIN